MPWSSRDLRPLRATAALVAAAVLSAAPAASAEQVTLGPGSLAALTPLVFDTPVCTTGPCTAYQDPLEGNLGPLWTSTVNGVVTSWSMRVSATEFSDQTGAANRYRLRIIRLAPGTSSDFVALRSSLTLTQLFPAEGTYATPVSLPIAVGDQIALGAVQNASLPDFRSAVTDHVRYNVGVADPPDGQVGQAFNSDNSSVLGLSATVEFCRVPDLRGKKLKRAKKLVRNAACDPKPKAKGKGATRKKRGRVSKQNPAAGVTVPPGTDVKLVYRR